MAYFFRNTGNSDWFTATNWSMTDGGPGNGSVPGMSDDAYFTVNSGPCAVGGANALCNNLDFTQGGGYGNTFTVSTATYYITVYANLSLSANSGANYTGAVGALLRIAGTSTLTSNSATLSLTLAIVGAGAPTLADDWNVYGLYLGTGGLYPILGSGFTLTVTNVLTGYDTSSGVKNTSTITKIVLDGSTTSPTWDYVRIECSMDMNVGASTTITIGSIADVAFDTGTLTCNVTTGGSITHYGTLTLYSGTVNTPPAPTGMNWNNISTANSLNTVTLTADLQINGNFSVGGSTPTHVMTFNGSSHTIFVNGNLTTGTGGGIKGTANLLLQSSLAGPWISTWTAGGSSGTVENNMTIKGFTFSVGGEVYYKTGLLKMEAL